MARSATKGIFKGWLKQMGDMVTADEAVEIDEAGPLSMIRRTKTQ